MGDSGAPVRRGYRDALAENYLATRVTQQQWELENQIVEHLLRRIPVGARVLDVPFGTGRFAPSCLDQGLQVTGIDISEEMLRIARKELGHRAELIDIRLCDALCIAAPDRAFDTVLSVRFLNLIPAREARRAIREFSRVASRQIILEVRVLKTSICSWIAAFVGMALSQNPIRTLRACKCLLLPKNLSAHPEGDLHAWFSESGLHADEVHILKERDQDARSLARPLCIFVLRKEHDGL